MHRDNVTNVHFPLEAVYLRVLSTQEHHVHSLIVDLQRHIIFQWQPKIYQKQNLMRYKMHVISICTNI